MFDKAMKIFESEFEFKAFMLQIANDYEKKYYLKKENFFYYIDGEEQLLAAAHAYKEYLDNANEREYNEKIKKIFTGAPVRQFTSEFEENNAPEKRYNHFEIFIMIVLSLCAFAYAIFIADVLTEWVVLTMSGVFLLISPFLALKGKIKRILKKRKKQ